VMDGGHVPEATPVRGPPPRASAVASNVETTGACAGGGRWQRSPVGGRSPCGHDPADP
jgi:hypothetical protein